MEKRSLLAIALSFLIFVVWLWIFGPKPGDVPPPPPEPVDVEETVQPGGQPDPGLAESRAAGQPEPEPEAERVAAESEQTETIENDLYRVELTNRGGQVLSWRLLLGGEQPLEVIPPLAPGEGQPRPLAVQLEPASLADEINDALFRVERQRTRDGERIIFSWADGRGLEVVKQLVFRHGSYLVDVGLDVTDRGRRLPARVSWGPGFATRDVGGGMANYYYAHTALWNLGGRVTHERELEQTSVLGGDRRTGSLLWAGVEDQYFAALIIPQGDDADVRVAPVEVRPLATGGEDGEPEPLDLPVVAVGVPEQGAILFVGPKNYRMLAALGHQLQKAVWFSSYALFDVMARLLYRVLIWIYENVVANYGVAIILTTMLLRIVLFPLNQFSMVRMKKTQLEMQRLQPKVNAIKKKFQKKKDAESRAKMNQEMMDLYKKEGVNPMGGVSGCLPLLIQFPILIGFYFMLQTAVELRGAPFFGWIQDLTLKDPLYVTPILMGVSMFVQQKMSTARMGDPTQQRIMMMMPLMFTVMFINLPSGLVLYWFVNNLLGIGQQYLVNRHTAKLEAPAKTKTKKA